MYLFGKSSSRRRSSEASSSSGSIRRSYVEPSASSIRDAATKSCLWPHDGFMVSAGIKEEFEQYVYNAELGPYIADKCDQHLTLTETFTKEFKFYPRESRVSFKLYENPFSIPLETFSNMCKIPYWGSLDEPPRAEYESFLTSLCYGENRGVTQGRIKSIHFPSIHYFALFNGKCVVGKQDCSALCAPDLSLIHTALTGIKCYNLGAIVARRLQHNASNGHFYGGIYASRLARELGVSLRPNDPILPTQYLDFEAMKNHEFLKGKIHDWTYNLHFNNKSLVPTFLPAPALFDFHRNQRYYVFESEARAYNAEVVAARRAAEEAPRASVSYHADYYSERGW